MSFTYLFIDFLKNDKLIQIIVVYIHHSNLVQKKRIIIKGLYLKEKYDAFFPGKLQLQTLLTGGLFEQMDFWTGVIVSPRNARNVY